MEFTDEEIELSKEAEKYMRDKENQRALISKYASLDIYPSLDMPTALFMAGSPGAGKTELSKRLIENIGGSAIRIDPDEIRGELPQYNGKNSNLFQSAVNIGVDKIFYHALKNRQNFILDGTFANYEKVVDNINHTLSKTDKAIIFYLFQDPIISWSFTQDREKEDHRMISKETFIKAFINSKDNANKVKQLFGKKVELNLVIKGYDRGIEELKINIDNVDNYLKTFYNKDELERLLQ